MEIAPFAIGQGQGNSQINFLWPSCWVRSDVCLRVSRVALMLVFLSHGPMDGFFFQDRKTFRSSKSRNWCAPCCAMLLLFHHQNWGWISWTLYFIYVTCRFRGKLAWEIEGWVGKTSIRCCLNGSTSSRCMIYWMVRDTTSNCGRYCTASIGHIGTSSQCKLCEDGLRMDGPSLSQGASSPTDIVDTVEDKTHIEEIWATLHIT